MALFQMAKLLRKPRTDKVQQVPVVKKRQFVERFAPLASSSEARRADGGGWYDGKAS